MDTTMRPAVVAVAAALFAVFQVRRTQRNVAATQTQPPQESEFFNEKLSPPLPQSVVEMVNASQLCYLATCEQGAPHLSLMILTHHLDASGDCLVLTTRRDTKKYAQLTKSPSVAVLVHDFPHLRHGAQGSEWSRTCSITLNGTATEPSGPAAEMLRAVHLKHNPDYAQFIAPAHPHNVAVIKITIHEARICDIKDKVTTWTRGKGLHNSYPSM